MSIIFPLRLLAGENAADEELLTRVKESNQHLKKYHFAFPSSDVHHRIPTEYVIDVPKGEKRRGLSEHLAVGFYSNFRSRYVSREYPCSKGPVWQPSFTIEAYNVGFNVWSNFVLNDEPNQGEFNEVDLSLYYTARIKNLAIHAYIMGFLYPNANPASMDYGSEQQMETDLLLRYEIWQMYLFSLARVGLVNTTGQVYWHLGVGFKHPFTSKFAMDTSALMSIGNSRFLKTHAGYDGTSVDALAWTLGFIWKPWKGLSLQPHFDIAVHVSPTVRKAIEQQNTFNNTIVWGGLDLAYDF